MKINTYIKSTEPYELTGQGVCCIDKIKIYNGFSMQNKQVLSEFNWNTAYSN